MAAPLAPSAPASVATLFAPIDRVPTEELGQDTYQLDDDGLRAVAERSGDVVQLGDRMMVEIIDVGIQRRTVYGRRIGAPGGDARTRPAGEGRPKPMNRNDKKPGGRSDGKSDDARGKGKPSRGGGRYNDRGPSKGGSGGGKKSGKGGGKTVGKKGGKGGGGGGGKIGSKKNKKGRR